MTRCYFVSDLHGRTHRYRALFDLLRREPPHLLFLGGDLLPHGSYSAVNYVRDFLRAAFSELRDNLGADYPRILLILGNDDGRAEEEDIEEGARDRLWEYVHNRRTDIGEYSIYGYACVPPTPFLLKDWERYDVSRYVDPGCVSPEEGRRTVSIPEEEARYATIHDDLARLAKNDDLSRAIFLFHTPPHRTKLDRAALDGKMVDHVPMDVHVGSIAVRRFIESRQPLLTLHGHIHESARLTGDWRDRIGRTHLFTAAHDGPELAVVSFDLDNLDQATRELI